MVKTVISSELSDRLQSFLESHPDAELVNTYLFFIERKLHLRPVVFPKEKKIYRSGKELTDKLEKSGDLWREAEIKIRYSEGSVNEATKKIYICPFTGKVFADNIHPNPQDAIYDWVSKCPENTERNEGMKVKRFHVSEDREVINEYAKKEKMKEPITKVVYSSTLNGKLFKTREAVVEDFKAHYIKTISMIDVLSQNKFEIEEHFLAFIQDLLEEEKVHSFVEALTEKETFLPHVQRWLA